MNKRRLSIIIALLAAGGILLWWGWTKNQSEPVQEQTPASMKADTAPEKDINVLEVLSRQTIDYTVQPGDALIKIARRYNTTLELIKKLNDLQGDAIRVGQKLKIPPGKFDVLVSKAKNRMELRLDGKPVKEYAVSTGKDNSTPVGDFIIVTRLENPTWYKTGAVIPPGSPENILGTRWLGISSKEHPKGFGIHGTVEPDKIGQAVTAGCVRMRNEDVEELYALLPEGTAVKIVETTESTQGKS